MLARNASRIIFVMLIEDDGTLTNYRYIVEDPST
jgi:hypothetical protein